VSEDTLRFHHDKHHKAYVDKTNTLAKNAGLEGRPLEDVVREARKRGDAGLFNNAAQAWNHAFFWQCMTPDKSRPSGALAQAIDQAFGGLDDLKKAFVNEGVAHFGSGWVWLAAEGEALKVLSTHDADDLLIQQGLTPLLVCDLWEHAYYLDHKNDRKGFLEAWFDALPNWEFAGWQLAAAQGRGEPWRHPAPQAAGPDLKTARAG